MSIKFAFLAPVLLVASGYASAQTPAPAERPAGATAVCKDGTYAKTTMKMMACKGHKGIATWYGKDGKGSTKATMTKSSNPVTPSVQTESAAVSTTGVAPAPGGQSLTPGKPASMAK